MRRSIVPLSLLAAAAAVCVLGIAGPASAARTAHIICPLMAPRIVACCPLPTSQATSSQDIVQPICCQTTPCCNAGGTTCCSTSTCCTPGGTTCCPPSNCCPSGGTTCCRPTPCTPGSLTIASSPNPSTAGRKVVISGGFVGNPVSGAQVALWRELAGQTSFHQVAQTTTDSAGHYTFTMGRGAVMADQAWYVISNGVQSATLQQHVHALVGLASSAHSTTVGRSVRLHGHVTPSHAGGTVAIQASRGGAFRTIGRARLGRGSSYAISLHFLRQGALKLRAVLRGDARNDRSASPIIALIVKP